MTIFQDLLQLMSGPPMQNPCWNRNYLTFWRPTYSQQSAKKVL